MVAVATDFCVTRDTNVVSFYFLCFFGFGPEAKCRFAVLRFKKCVGGEGGFYMYMYIYTNEFSNR